MKRPDEILEDLIQTIERNAIYNQAQITNVKLWADSWREELHKFAVSSSLRERELNKYLEEINAIMWNTWGVKHNKFDKEEGSKIMSILNRWASNDC